MKLKYYLRGLGTGIFFATVILILLYTYNSTDKKIIEKAKDLGMSFAKEETTKKEDVSSNKETTTPVVAQTTLESIVAETTKEETTKTETTKTETTKTVEVESTTKAVEIDQTTLTITRGMTSEDVAKRLESMGVIKNSADFNKFLVENGYAEKIHVGNFLVEKDKTYEQIAGLIAN